MGGMSQGSSASGTMGVTWMVGTGKERLCGAVAKEGMGGSIVCFVHQENPAGVPVMGRVQGQEAQESL